MSGSRTRIYSIDTDRKGRARNSVLINKIVVRDKNNTEETTTNQTVKRERKVDMGRGTKNAANRMFGELPKDTTERHPNPRGKKNTGNNRKNIPGGGENKISQDSMGSLSRKVHKGRRGGYRYSDLGMKGISIDFGELRKKQRKTLKAKKKKLSKQKKAKKHGKGTKRVKRKRVQSRRKK